MTDGPVTLTQEQWRKDRGRWMTYAIEVARVTVLDAEGKPSFAISAPRERLPVCLCGRD